MTGDPRRWLPAAVAVLAIAAMAVAARRDGPLDSGVSTGLWDGARPAMALAAVVLLVVIATNFAKHRDDGYGVLHRAGTATAVLLTAAAVLTPIGLLLFGRKPEPPPQQPEVSNGPATPKHPVEVRPGPERRAPPRRQVLRRLDRAGASVPHPGRGAGAAHLRPGQAVVPPLVAAADHAASSSTRWPRSSTSSPRPSRPELKRWSTKATPARPSSPATRRWSWR